MVRALDEPGRRAGNCPDPNRVEFEAQGLGLAALADYDWSPFGDVNQGGDYLAISLGIAWNCPSSIGFNRAPIALYGQLGPCYRETNVGAQLSVDPGSTRASSLPPFR